MTLYDLLWPYVAFSGKEGGAAIADAIFGLTNAWGKMPYTVYPASWVNTTSMLDHDVQHGRGRTYRFATYPVHFPFGFGLSYSSFHLALAASPQSWTLPTQSTEIFNLSVTVTNRGDRAGDEVVQVCMQSHSYLTENIYASHSYLTISLVISLCRAGLLCAARADASTRQPADQGAVEL